MNSRNKQLVECWRKEALNLPDGMLHCVTRNGRVFFYNRYNGRRAGITGNRELVYALARKRYLALLISAHEKATELSCNTNSLPLEKLLEYYTEKGLTLARITCSKEQYKWMEENYRRNPVDPEQRVYQTHSGLKMRSKSEQTIGNALERNGVPYRYEPEIRIDVGWMEDVSAPYKTYYPDFVILTADGTEIIWEHLGRVDLKAYRDHNMEKISAYREGMGIDERQLILTFENDLRDLENIDRIVERRIMPYI